MSRGRKGWGGSFLAGLGGQFRGRDQAILKLRVVFLDGSGDSIVADSARQGADHQPEERDTDDQQGKSIGPGG